MSISRSLTAAATVLLLSACASRGPAVETAVLPDADPATAFADRAEYRIGPSDLLAVTVFQITDLDREVRVNNAGQVTLPLIGVIEARGRTVAEFESQIADAYRTRYLQDPQVTVFVKEFASQRVTVGGAVEKPGIYPVTSRLTLLQAIALAEGVTEYAALRNVVVFRNAGGERHFARFDIRAIADGEQPDPELHGEDVVVVDTSAGKVALQNLIKLTPFASVWRAYR